MEGLLESEMNYKECCSVKPKSFIDFSNSPLKINTSQLYCVDLKRAKFKSLLCCCIRIRNPFCSVLIKFYSTHHSYRWRDEEWYLDYNMSFLEITTCNCETTVSKWNQQTVRVSDETWRNKTLKIPLYILHSLILLFS